MPTWQHAFADPRAQEATALMVRMFREHDAYEANLFNENALLISGSIFPYFYALSGDRNPKQPPKPGPRSEYSQLAVDTFALIRARGRSRNNKCVKIWAEAFRWLLLIRRWANCGRGFVSREWTMTTPADHPGMFYIAGRLRPSEKEWKSRSAKRCRF